MNLTDFSTLSFDCYGTLIDWESGILAVLRPWADHHRLDVDDDGLLEAFGRHETRVQQNNPDMLYPDVLRETMAAISKSFGKGSWKHERDALGDSVPLWPVFQDSPMALHFLKKNFRLVVLSNVDNASFAHSNKKLGVEFDLVVTAEDVGSYKPDPRNFQAMLARLGAMGVRPKSVLHTAQSLYHDIAPARDAGLTTCWINRRQGRVGAGATPPANAWPNVQFPSLKALADADRAERAGQAGGYQPPPFPG